MASFIDKLKECSVGFLRQYQRK